MSETVSKTRLTAVPPDFPRGVKLLHDPVRNKGTAFSPEERDLLGIRGLLPPRSASIETQVMRIMESLRNEPTDLARFMSLISLQDRNETLFYRVLVDHLQELMPIIYTPTVGKACQEYGHIFRRPRGMYISADYGGKIADVLVNWPHDDVRIIVVTDGERILGLGDLGADGMGIPVGKLSLYTACAGIHPTQCLPITLDVGTNNADLLSDPLYIGLTRERLRGEAYDAFVDEFIDAVTERFPRAVIQLEDFATTNAFRLLGRYRDRAPVFDDDIQGTGSVALAGLYAGLRLSGKPLRDARFLFLGAGEAGIGIGDLIVAALADAGIPETEARRRCWYFDSKGLVVQQRDDLAEHKRPFAHDAEFTADFLSAVRSLRPDGIIGVSGQPQTFTREIVQQMAASNARPLIFALSNPTSKSECTARQAYAWSEGRAVFASGSPFDPVDFGGRTHVPGQGNNAYVFPGVGLGVVASDSSRVTDEMFYVAAQVLANEVVEGDLAVGRVYPSLTRIRDVSRAIATRVAETAYDRGLARAARPDDLEAHVASLMFEPEYPQYA